MDDLRTRAQLVAFDAASAGAGAVGTVITRAEISETAARGEFPATLLLDLDRAEPGDGGDVTAHARVAVDWDKETLDQLLASTDDNEIALWFDERELATAFDDVEGHGLRQKAAVLAVAAAAAGASAAPSFAAFSGHEVSSDQTPAAYSVDPQAHGGGPTVQASGAERALQMDERNYGSTDRVQPAAGFNVDPTASGAGRTAQSAGAERGLQQDEQVAVQQAKSTSAGGGSTLSSGEIAGIAGTAGLLLISAAGFGATRKRMPPAQPA